MMFLGQDALDNLDNLDHLEHPDILFHIDKLLDAAIVVDRHGALLDGAVADIDVRGGINIEDVGGSIDEAFALAGTLVVLSTRIIGHLAQSELAIDDVDVVNLAGHIATDERTVLGGADYVAEPDVSHFAARTFGLALGETPVAILVIARSTGVGGDIDRLGLAPPNVAEIVALDDEVVEDDVGHGALVTVLNADATVRRLDDAVLDEHVADAVHVLRTDLDGAGTTRHDAVGDNDVLAGTIFFPFTTVLEADAVVARSDVAVGNAYLLGVVDVDAVAIAYLEVVEQRDADDRGIVAADEVNRPVGAVADGDIANLQLLDTDEGEHVRTGIELVNGLEFVTVEQFFAHETDAVAVDGALAGDGDVAGVLGPKPHHALAFVLLEGTQFVDALVGIGQPCGIRFEMIIDVRLEFDGTTQKRVTGREDHLPATLGRTCVDCFLDGSSVIGNAIALGTEIEHVVGGAGAVVGSLVT